MSVGFVGPGVSDAAVRGVADRTVPESLEIKAGSKTISVDHGPMGTVAGMTGESASEWAPSGTGGPRLGVDVPVRLGAWEAGRVPGLEEAASGAGRPAGMADTTGGPGMVGQVTATATAEFVSARLGEGAAGAERVTAGIVRPAEYALREGTRGTNLVGSADRCEAVDDCDGITTIAPYPNDGHVADVVDTENLTDATRAALSCLTAAVGRNGGTLTVESAHRPHSYQLHLLEVYDKYKGKDGQPGVETWPEGKCPEVRSNVMMEWNRHAPISVRPAEHQSQHSLGVAFDANWGALADGVGIDGLAHECGTCRPVGGRGTLSAKAAPFGLGSAPPSGNRGRFLGSPRRGEVTQKGPCSGFGGGGGFGSAAPPLREIEDDFSTPPRGGSDREVLATSAFRRPGS